MVLCCTIRYIRSNHQKPTSPSRERSRRPQKTASDSPIPHNSTTNDIQWIIQRIVRHTLITQLPALACRSRRRLATLCKQRITPRKPSWNLQTNILQSFHLFLLSSSQPRVSFRYTASATAPAAGNDSLRIIKPR